MNRPVRVGNVQQMSGARPMNTGTPTPPKDENGFWDILWSRDSKEDRDARSAAYRAANPDAWVSSDYGLPGFLNALNQSRDDSVAAQKRQFQGIKNWFTGSAEPRPFSGIEYLPGVDGSRGGQGGTGFGARAAERFGEQPQEPGMTREEYAALFGGGGGGAARPDFSAYRAALTDQAAGLNAQIQAMYNALGEEAGANVGRIQDIYGGAEQGIGNVYDSAAGNVADAFSSSQQQAADQMARLGIEAAAPSVINPAALAQAQAVSGLEQGRASGQAAAQRYGASAGGFGSQMAQVAQQQGTETNAAILASLQNRLAESLAAEQTGGGGGGGGGMSVRDQLALREAYNRDVLGQLPLDERRLAFDVAQAAARPANEYSTWQRDKFVELTTPRRSGEKPLYTPEEAQAYLNAVESSLGAGR